MTRVGKLDVTQVDPSIQPTRPNSSEYYLATNYKFALFLLPFRQHFLLTVCQIRLRYVVFKTAIFVLALAQDVVKARLLSTPLRNPTSIRRPGGLLAFALLAFAFFPFKTLGHPGPRGVIAVFPCIELGLPVLDFTQLFLPLDV